MEKEGAFPEVNLLCGLRGRRILSLHMKEGKEVLFTS